MLAVVSLCKNKCFKIFPKVWCFDFSNVESVINEGSVVFVVASTDLCSVIVFQ